MSGPLFTPSAAAAGFALGASLIVAIGAQNAFVLKQGLRRNHELPVAVLCVVIDATLITLGVAGFGSLVSSAPWLTTAAAWGGAAFLTVYGALSFRSAVRGETLRAGAGDADLTLAAALSTTLAVSLLNPHVYLDTIVLLGGIAAQYPVEARSSFGLGAVCASTVWFLGLALGARLLAPVFARPAAWRVLDTLIGVIMWWIAISLVLGQVRG